MAYNNLSKNIIPYICEAESLPEDLQKEFIKFAVNENYSKDISEIKKLTVPLKISRYTLENLCGTFIYLVNSCRHTKPKDFHEVLKQYGLKDAFINNIITTVHNLLLKNVQSSRSCLNDVRWKIDLSLVEKKLGLSSIVVHINLDLSNGKKVIFSMDQRKFHLLRYNVTVILKQFLKLKQTISIKDK